MEQVISPAELAARAEQQLQTIADTGNTLAQVWLWKLQTASIPLRKTALLGEMRAILRLDKRPKAKEIYQTVFKASEQTQELTRRD